MRYKFTRVKKDKVEGVRYKSTTLYPTITRKDSDITYYTKFGDSYGSLAHRFYGDQTLWWIIAQANGIKGFTSLYPNNFKGQLRIPTQIQDILTEFNSINGV